MNPRVNNTLLFAPHLSPVIAADAELAAADVPTRVIVSDLPQWQDGGPVVTITIRRRTLVVIVITILIHCLLFYAFTRQSMLKLSTPGAGRDLIVYLQPPIAKPEHPAANKNVRKRKQVPPRGKRHASRRAPARIRIPQGGTTKPLAPTPPPVPTPPVVPMAAPPTTDLASYIAMMKARRDAAEHAGENPEDIPQSDDARRDEIIRQNLQPPGTSGVFTILRMDSLSATFRFRSWTSSVDNARTQDVDVAVDPSGDIKLAIVQKMIELIRQKYKGDFNFESRRLGRTVVLSARLEDTAGLQAFLMREFAAEFRNALDANR